MHRGALAALLIVMAVSSAAGREPVRVSRPDLAWHAKRRVSAIMCPEAGI